MPFIDASRSPFEVRLGHVLALRPHGLPAAAAPESGSLRDESLDAAADGVLGEIEELERAKARLESRLLEAYAALHTVEEQLVARTSTTVRVSPTAERVVTHEIACATGVGPAEVSRRLELALAPRRHRVLHERLRQGAVSLHRALVVVAETRNLPDDALPAVTDTVLAPAADGSVASQRLFRSRLRRCVTSADRRGTDERHVDAVRARGVFGRLTDDGMGTITVTASAERVVAVLERVDALARAARAGGDPRTLDQLRSDALCSLTTFGQLGPEHGSFARPPAAAVRIVVPFEVAAGLSDAACELLGHGWVTAAHARRIMTAEGSVWQRLAVDVRTGRALELSTDRYRPTPAMVEHVRAVDGVCRAPGCEVPAERCDLDHVTAWPAGATHVANLQSLSRGCHLAKTAGLWSVTREPDGGLRWVSPAGRIHTTYPRDWRAALADPGADPPQGQAGAPAPFSDPFSDAFSDAFSDPALPTTPPATGPPEPPASTTTDTAPDPPPF